MVCLVDDWCSRLGFWLVLCLLVGMFCLMLVLLTFGWFGWVIVCVVGVGTCFAFVILACWGVKFSSCFGCFGFMWFCCDFGFVVYLLWVYFVDLKFVWFILDTATFVLDCLACVVLMFVLLLNVLLFCFDFEFVFVRFADFGLLCCCGFVWFVVNDFRWLDYLMKIVVWV